MAQYPYGVVLLSQIIAELGGSNNYFQNSFTVLMDAMARDVNIVTENGMINELLSTGGMNGMLNTVWLILCAMCFNHWKKKRKHR